MFERGKKEGYEAGEHAIEDSRGETMTGAASRSRVSSESAVIGRSIKIDGDLQGEEDLRIEGNVTGTVKLASNSLTVGKEGQIRADIYAKSITVDGLVEGDLYGSERVSIRKNAKVKGNITAPRVSLEEGARFRGSIEMDSEAVSKALGKTPSASKPAPVSTPSQSKKEESAA